MDDGNKHPSKRRKDLKAATHILKREALRRYREKLHRRLAEEEKSAKLASLNAGHSTDDDRLNNTLSNTKVGSDILPSKDVNIISLHEIYCTIMHFCMLCWTC